MRLLGKQDEMFPQWRHFPFFTNRTDPIDVVEAEHRQHAVIELSIRDLKDQGLTHFPSGRFNANGAWTVLAALAHNLLRWTQTLGLPGTTIRTARTIRDRLLHHAHVLITDGTDSYRLAQATAGKGVRPLA